MVNETLLTAAAVTLPSHFRLTLDRGTMLGLARRLFPFPHVWRSVAPEAESVDLTRWAQIRSSRQEAAAVIARIEEALNAAPAPLGSSDLSVVVFGSIARGEWTSSSDVDWLILIDGQADPQHGEAARLFRSTISQLGLDQPSPIGAFGNLEFSHALIHQIGGEEDTNSNITRRVSLLLEACAIGRRDSLDRTVRGIIDRYVDDVLVTTHIRRNPPRVPRFLLNDIVRFWRTMAVDYANKKRARAAEKWALRNLKLRMSRKLIFASGLIMCFSCAQELTEKWTAAGQDDESVLRTLMNEHLLTCSRRRPLEVVASAALAAGGKSLQDQMLEHYDHFLGLLNDADSRTHLEKLPLDQAATDSTWKRVNTICGGFEDALITLFFDCEPYRALTRRFGVF